MGDEAQHARLGGRPGERRSGRGARPGFEIGEVAGERPQGIRAGAGLGQMRQRVDLGRIERVGESVARGHRQHAGEHVDGGGCFR